MNPLLFCPSPRDIPRVKQSWSKLNYDKLIIKYKPEEEVYQEAREFFIKHEEYTHIVICADDLVIEKYDLETLLEDAEFMDVVDGICNIDESQPFVYACQPEGCDLTRDKPDTSGGSYYSKDKKPIIPNIRFLKVGHSGAACRVINRETFKKISFGCVEKGGWTDYQMSKELSELNIPIIVDTSVNMWHMRTSQKPVNEYGYTLFIKR